MARADFLKHEQPTEHPPAEPNWSHVRELGRRLDDLLLDEDLDDEKLREASEGLLPNLADAIFSRGGRARVIEAQAPRRWQLSWEEESKLKEAEEALEVACERLEEWAGIRVGPGLQNLGDFNNTKAALAQAEAALKKKPRGGE
jgi:hypothetical protein